MRTSSQTNDAFEERKHPVSLLVFHCFALSTKEMLSHLKKNGASIHYLIQRNGKIIPLIPEDKVAYHAGISQWRHFTKINHHSIGIEIQNSKMGEAKYTQKQIKNLIQLSKRIIKKYHILPENIVGHSDICPFRKPDPGRLFPWEELAKQGIGIWPDAQTFFHKDSGQNSIQNLLKKIGYNTIDLEASLYAFTKRFLPERAPICIDIVLKEKRCFQYWRGIKADKISSKMSLAPCIYPQNTVRLKNDLQVLATLEKVAHLYTKE